MPWYNTGPWYKWLTIILLIAVAWLGWWQYRTYKYLRDEIVRGWIQAHGFVYDDPGPPDPTKPPDPPPPF